MGREVEEFTYSVTVEEAEAISQRIAEMSYDEQFFRGGAVMCVGAAREALLAGTSFDALPEVLTPMQLALSLQLELPTLPPYEGHTLHTREGSEEIDSFPDDEGYLTISEERPFGRQ
jgi:hypothetical protein